LVDRVSNALSGFYGSIGFSLFRGSARIATGNSLPLYITQDYSGLPGAESIIPVLL
jgi:hypothetical protein